MEEVKLRPKLVSFRVMAFLSENRNEGNGSQWLLEMRHEIEVGLNVPTVAGGVLQAVVNITLHANAKNEQATAQSAEFKGEYVAKFNYPTDSEEAVVAPLIEQDPHQYVLVAQAYPLAMMHFRRELLASGFDGRTLPLGI